MGVLELVDQVLLQHRLDHFGIVPRSPIWVRGVLFTPLLRGTWQHLMANTLPFAVLGWLTLLRGVTEFTLTRCVTGVTRSCCCHLIAVLAMAYTLPLVGTRCM
jgi:membrane associated rhomboid family serine protease